MDKPSVGRIVHFNDKGVCRAALITKVQFADDRLTDAVDLTVFVPSGDEPLWRWPDTPYDGRGDHPMDGVETRASGTWHWPERT